MPQADWQKPRGRVSRFKDDVILCVSGVSHCTLCVMPVLAHISALHQNPARKTVRVEYSPNPMPYI